jgi:RNA polymerase sigma-70 factor (ECF subfamily)
MQNVAFSQDSPFDFRVCFEQTRPFVRSVLRRSGVPDVDLDDLVQEIFVVVCRKLPTYDRLKPFRYWLYGICARTASSYRRSASVRERHAREIRIFDPLEPRVVSDPEHDAELRNICARLEAILYRMKPEQREVFVLFEIEELAMTEIARATGCPLQTAYSRLHAARKAVRSMLGVRVTTS